MNYDAELRLVSDTLKRYGIGVLLADPQHPVSRYWENLAPFLSVDAASGNLPLAECMPPVEDGKVYILSDWMGCCYLYLRLPDFGQEALMIIGPYLSHPVSNSQILEQAEVYGIAPQHHPYLTRYYGSLPLWESASHLHILLDTFFERLWGAENYTFESLSREELYDATPLRPSMKINEEDQTLWNMDILEKRYARENMLMDAVRNGQLQKIENLTSRITAAAFEQRLPDQVRNVKNYCIISNTLLRKAAEQGGVHPIYLDNLSSTFAARIEQMRATSEAPEMVSNLARAYCRLVRQHSMKNYSATIQKAVVLIDSDLTAELSLRFLAEKLNVNSSYLSTLFKKETGQTVTEYITQQRVRHARYLLENTRLQIQTVAQHCGISDVHYFSKLFKAATGMTPKEYRRSLGR